MNRLNIKFIALIALVSASCVDPAFAQEGPVNIPDPTRDGRQMVAFLGDSITEGVITDEAIPAGLPNKERMCWQNRCYAAIVGHALSEGFNVDSSNRGYGGATSRDWDPNDRQEDDVHFFFSLREEGLLKTLPAANMVVIYIGTNDAIAFFENGPPISPDDYEALVEDTVLTLRSRGVRKFLLVAPPIPTTWENNEKGDTLREYGYRIRDIARRRAGVFLADAAAEFPREGWPENSIHPNILGHEALAEIVLEGILRNLRPRNWRLRR